MKKILMLVAITLFCKVSYGQDINEIESFVSNNVVSKNYGLPIIRNIYGGTKIIVEFQGNWTNEMKGAFEYACKIWEEAMPTTFPIRVLAKLDETKESSALSKISFKTVSNAGRTPYIYSTTSTWTQVKGSLFLELSGRYDADMYHNIVSEDMFVEPDITLTYYNKSGKLVDNCSFSIGNLSDNNYYDFVTLVLRDLAKSFGLVWRYTNVRNEQFRINKNDILPYESLALSAAGYNLRTEQGSLHDAYMNSLQDTLRVVVNRTDVWSLYAPSTWNTVGSLNCFFADNQKKITQLLSPDFGRGTVVRDLSDRHTCNMFRDLLSWDANLIVGMGDSFAAQTSSTSEIVPFGGEFTFANTTSTLTGMSSGGVDKISEKSVAIADDESFNWYSALLKFHPNYRSNGSSSAFGWTVSLMLKDGTWDVVFEENTGIMSPVPFSTSDLTVHYNIEDYARTCDGYLRCRITEKFYSLPSNRTNTVYSVLDYLPQRVQMAKTMVMPCVDEEDYYREVKIGLRNIEGVTRVVVSQLDEGNDFAYEYEVPDFEKGYFIATVDREFTSTFTITAYNKNGSTVSYPYVLEPLTPVDEIELMISKKNDNIYVSPLSRKRQRNIDRNYISTCQLYKVDSNVQKCVQGITVSKNNIDVSCLNKGIYLLMIKDIKGKQHPFKFVK